LAVSTAPQLAIYIQIVRDMENKPICLAKNYFLSSCFVENIISQK